MKVTVCDICNDKITRDTMYVEMYQFIGEDGDTKPCMPRLELCPLCGDSIRKHIREAAFTERNKEDK